ncbi:MAG TPA: class I SAM-dependent rRNA methyltransferase [Waddliaceae bacterium]
MGTSKKLILKPGKEKPLRNRHHWIFSGAVSSFPDNCDGEIIPVYTSDGECLGHAYFNPQVSILGRMISFGDIPPREAIKLALTDAIAFRQIRFKEQSTNAYRLINGEGDGLPGLIVDIYNNILVLQILTLGMERMRSLIIDALKQALNPRAIYEKSLHGSRKEEGLDFREGVIHGPDVDEVEIRENGLKFIVSLKQGQKTGFFLDQREMRKQIMALATDKRVLNCFSYTGGFSVYALAGGANFAISVDSSEYALESANRNILLNGFFEKQHQARQSDAFEFLRKEKLDYEIVILDPPAFAKGKKDVVAACRGYKELNCLAIRRMPQDSYLLTCSCSNYISADLFQKVIFQAAADAKRPVRIVGRHQIASDHPVNLFHPETEYLKSLLLYIS